MTSYWDEKSRRVKKVFDDHENRDVIIGEVADIEQEAIVAVTCDVTDKDLPGPHREKLLAILSGKAILDGERKQVDRNCERLLRTSTSELIEALHSAYHDLATDHPAARWGAFGPSPSQNQLSRSDFDGQEGD